MPKSIQTIHREQNHLCLDCGTPVEAGVVRCNPHAMGHIKKLRWAKEYRKTLAAKLRKQYHERFQAGLCTACGKEPHREGRKTCEKCATRAASWAKKNPERALENARRWRSEQDPHPRKDTHLLQHDPVVREKKNGYMAEYMRNYWKNNPEKYELHKAHARDRSKKQKEKRDAARLKSSAQAAAAPAKPDVEAG